MPNLERGSVSATCAVGVRRGDEASGASFAFPGHVSPKWDLHRDLFLENAVIFSYGAHNSQLYRKYLGEITHQLDE